MVTLNPAQMINSDHTVNIKRDEITSDDAAQHVVHSTKSSSLFVLIKCNQRLSYSGFISDEHIYQIIGK